MHSNDWNSDSPWNRLPWTLPAALLIWAAALGVFAFFMGKPASRPIEPPPIDAQFIEQPIPYAEEEIGPGRAVAGGPESSQPEPQAEMQPAPETPQPVERAEQQPEVKPQPVVPVRPVIPVQRPKPVVKPHPVVVQHHPKPVVKQSANAAAPAAAANGPAREEHGEGGSGTVGEQSAGIGAQGGSPYGKGTSTGSLYGNSGARAIIQPLPQIPDELRREALNSSVLARFQIAADGTAQVELTRPAQDVRLNRIMMDTLKKWRFMPAIKNGKPVASTEEILVKIEVK